MNVGKVFENDVKESLKDQGLFVIRLKDDAVNLTSRTKNLCDFIVFKTPFLILLELKSYKGFSIPLANITQRAGLEHTTKYKKILPLLLLNYRDFEETYFLHIDYLQLIDKRKSISLDFCRKYGVLVPQKKKKVHYTYSIDRALEVYLRESKCK